MGLVPDGSWKRELPRPATTGQIDSKCALVLSVEDLEGRGHEVSLAPVSGDGVVDEDGATVVEAGCRAGESPEAPRQVS
jgi:hypothetical protein